MSETTDVRTPSDAGDAAPWLSSLMPCVYCGRMIERSSQRCPECKTSYSMAVRKASREVEGDWFYLEPRNPSNRGVDFRTILKLIEKGRLRSDSIVRGPATHQDWMYAAEAPMLSKHLGNCPHCFGPADGGEEFCRTCGRSLDELPGRIRPGLSGATANVRFRDREQMEQSLAEALKTHDLARTAAMAASPAADRFEAPDIERSSASNAAAGRQNRERQERRRPKATVVALLTVVTLIPLALLATYVPWYRALAWSDSSKPGSTAYNVRTNQDHIKNALAGLFGGGGPSGSGTEGQPSGDPSQDANVQAVLAAADKAAAEGDLERAMSLTGPLSTTLSGTPLAAELTAKRQQWQAALDRQALANRARQMLERARSTLDGGNPNQALAMLQEIDSAARGSVSAEADELEGQIRAAIRAAAEEERQNQLKREVQTLVQKASREEQQGKLPEALATYKDIQNRYNPALWPSGVDIADRISRVEKRIAARTAPVDPPPPAADPQQARAEGLWRDVQKLDGEKKYEEALKKAEELQAMPAKYRPAELEEKITYLKKRIELKRKYEFFQID